MCGKEKTNKYDFLKANGVESFDKKDFEEFYVEDIYGQDELVGEHDVEQEGPQKGTGPAARGAPQWLMILT